MNRKEKDLRLRIVNAVCGLLLCIAIIYALVAGFDLLAIGLIASSTIGAAVPVVLAGEGVLEIIVGVLEALLEGVVEIFSAIFGAISNIFN